MRIENHERLISAYVNETIKKSDIVRVESIINESEEFREFYVMKNQEKAFLLSLIPNKSCSSQSKKSILKTIKSVNDEVYPKEAFIGLKRIYKFMTTPIIEF
jgi:hypothetical protein